MFPKNMYTTSGLSILLHGVISLPDATSYDNHYLNMYAQSSSRARLKFGSELYTCTCIEYTFILYVRCEG